MVTLLAQTGSDGNGRTSDPGPGSAVGRAKGISDRMIQWVLLYGNRRVLSLFLSIVILGLLLSVGSIWEFEMERLVVETRAVQTLFNTLLGGVILFVSVVLSINTAALSQEFAPLQVKLSQIEDSIEFQAELEKLVDNGVSPAGMQPFLRFVIQAIRSEMTILRNEADDASPDDRSSRGHWKRDVLTFVEDVEAQLTLIEGRIRSDDTRTSLILLSGLDYPYARHINTARRIRALHEDDLSDTVLGSFDTLLQTLVVLASGREYFTTLYFKRELRKLSSDLLVLSLPVIVFTSYTLLAIDANLFPEVTLPGVAPRLLYVLVAFVIALSPYVLLSSYMLRIITVSKHSLESTVFTLGEGDMKPEPISSEADQ